MKPTSRNEAPRSRFPSLQFSLPGWVQTMLPDPKHPFTSPAEKMALTIELSRLNVVHQTGGPFGAAIFEMQTHRLVAPGVNIVVESGWSGGHAEMVAFAIAQKIVGSHDLGSSRTSGFELFASSEPCSMCFGAIPWSGIERLVCAARAEDVQSIGFDEGPKPDNWQAELERRGIAVLTDMMRPEAVAVLEQYRTSGGMIYNGRGDI